MRHSEYTKLFRSFAEKHHLIRHSARSIHFARIVLSSSPFPELVIEEFLNATRTKLYSPFMLLQSYEARFSDNLSDNIWKIFDGAFIILEKCTQGDFDQQEEIFDRTEQIGEEIIAKFIHHLRKEDGNKSLYNISPSDITIEKVIGIAGKYHGVRVDFSFKKTANQNLKYNPIKFL